MKFFTPCYFPVLLTNGRFKYIGISSFLVFLRKELCEAKPGYRVGNFDQITMLKYALLSLCFTLKRSMLCPHTLTMLYPKV